MADDSDSVSKLWRVRRTVSQMLNDREYLVAQEDIALPLERFKENFQAGMPGLRDRLQMLQRKRDNAAEQIFVFFPEEKKLGSAHIKNFLGRMESEKVGRSIMVLRGSLSPFGKSLLQDFEDKFQVEIFTEDDLLVNITEHVLVPKHKVLTDQEKQTLLEKYKLKETQLPRIQFNDPVARYYGMTKSQVVKIIRPSETAGRYVTYRLVV